MTHWSWFL